MSPIVLQTLFLACYLAFLVWMRLVAHDRLLRQNEKERERREALEREWRVGIPYDPEPKRPKRRWSALRHLWK